jgi:hypothetical protein
MRCGVMGFFFVAVAIIMVGCAGTPVQQTQINWTTHAEATNKFMENMTKNLDAVNKKLDEVTKEQAETRKDVGVKEKLDEIHANSVARRKEEVLDKRLEKIEKMLSDLKESRSPGK